MGRLLSAGLLAGLVLNIGEAALHGAILADGMAEAYASLSRTIPEDPMFLAALVALTFGQGILLVWLATALRPKSGSWMASAVCTGLIGWLLSSVYAATYISSGFPGLLPNALTWIPVGWQLIEFPLAVVAGSSVLKRAALN